MVTTEHPQAQGAELAEACEVWCAAELCGEVPRLIQRWWRHGCIVPQPGPPCREARGCAS